MTMSEEDVECQDTSEPFIHARLIKGERSTAGLDLTPNNFAVAVYCAWQDMGMPMLYGGKCRVSVGLS